MVTVSRALSVAVCLLSVVLALLSYRALSPFADKCRQGSDTFITRQAGITIVHISAADACGRSCVAAAVGSRHFPVRQQRQANQPIAGYRKSLVLDNRT
jgi:hypothetical protein